MSDGSRRNSTGVRGLKLQKDDTVISMSILTHAEADSTDARDAYLRYANALRRGDADRPDHEPAFDQLAAEEEFILSVTANGYGKRTSAYECRIAGRGGQGIINIETSSRNGEVVASFPVEDDDHILLVTDGGQLIRVPVADIRIAGRNTQGVTLFKTAKDEHVVSVSRLSDVNGEDEENGADDENGVEEETPATGDPSANGSEPSDNSEA